MLSGLVSGLHLTPRWIILPDSAESPPSTLPNINQLDTIKLLGLYWAGVKNTRSALNTDGLKPDLHGSVKSGGGAYETANGHGVL